jgi:hypothetical protein
MKTILTDQERKDLAAYLLPLVNGEYRNLYQPKRVPTPTLYHPGKPWQQSGAKMAQNLNEIKVSELAQLSDFELQELKVKIDKAVAAKKVQTRNARYFLK